MSVPHYLKYSKEHTWLLLEGNTGTVGITAFAQSELGEIVYVDLPSIGESFSKDQVFGSVEALKTVSDLFMPVSGVVIAINPLLKNEPTLINNQPFEAGWMIKIKLADTTELQNLLTADDYIKITAS